MSIINVKEYIRNCMADKEYNSPEIISQGVEEGVYFYTEKSKKSYIISSPSIEALNSLSILELKALLPKFGKWEIENFFEEKFLTALLVTRDMTSIFNTTVFFYDIYPYDERLYFESERVRKIFLKNTLNVEKETDNFIYLNLLINSNKE